MTSGGLGTLPPKIYQPNGWVVRVPGPGAYSQRGGRDDPGGGTRAAARVLLHGHAVLRRAVLAGGCGQCLQSDAAGVRGAVRKSTAATALDRDPDRLRRARGPRRP